MGAKFDEIDADKSGMLDRDEITVALKKMGKSEEDIKRELDYLDLAEIDFDGFKLLARPPPKGAAMWANLTDDELRKKFDELDTDRSGKLDRQEIAAGLRKLGRRPSEIKAELDRMQHGEVDFDGFKM